MKILCLFTFARKMEKISILLIVIFLPLHALASGGNTDILMWKGDTLALYSNPLTLRDDYDLLLKQIVEEVHREIIATYPTDSNYYFGSTVCGRGHIVEWILINDSIFLNKIYPCYYPEVKINFKKIFPNIGENQKIFASWINGDLYLQQGELLHVGYTSIFEFETVLNIENGLLKNVEHFHNKIAKRSAFFEKAMYGKAREFADKNVNWDNLPDLKNKSIKINLCVNIDEQGQIVSINENRTYCSESYWNESTQRLDSSKTRLCADINDAFIKETFRIAKLVPEWDVIYQRGEIMGRYLSIEFSEKKRKEYER